MLLFAREEAPFRSQLKVDAGVWTISSFRDFSEGILADGGANTYVTASGEVRLINVWDLNSDGFIDIVFPNTHDNNQQVDLFIYWGIHNFSVRSRSRLPTDGGVAHTTADLNRDGYADLVVANHFNGVTTELNSYIYWGGEKGFAVLRRTELPTFGAAGVAASDLNGDSYPDLVFANTGHTYEGIGEGINYSYVYWGSQNGFSPKNRLELETDAARDVKLADLNGDGVFEVIFANEGMGHSEGLP